MSKLSILLAVFLTTLTGCASYNSNVPNAASTPKYTPALAGGGATAGALIGSASGTTASVVTGAAIGGAAGGLLGFYLDSQNNLTTKLNKAGVQVVAIGDNVTITIPSDKCFESGTANLEDDFQPTLTNVATLIKVYGDVPVTVTAYTDNVDNAYQTQMITKAQADSIVAYLWVHGISQQRLYGVGKGSVCPIASNETVTGSAINRRVEITLRKNP